MVGFKRVSMILAFAIADVQVEQERLAETNQILEVENATHNQNVPETENVTQNVLENDTVMHTADLLEKQGVSETQILEIHDIATLDAYAKYENVSKKNNKISLRSKRREQSMINIKENITKDNWSFEVQVKNLVMNDVEKAGVYVWYTEKELTSGGYKGGNTVFNGFLAGIEFSKDRADLVFSFNYGLDFKNKELQTTRFDHINPALIDHLDHLILKVIHTEQNFKVEIYDVNKNLISDSFRIHDPLVMNKGPTKKHFALTTKYEHCADDLFFDLQSLKINERNEKEAYDHTHILTEHNIYPRNKSDEEIRVAIADISHFMNYLVIVLGSSTNNNIVEMTMEAKKKLRIVQNNIDNLIGESGTKVGVSQAAQEKSLKNKIQDLEASLAANIERVEEMKNKFKLAGKTTGLNIKGILLCGSLAGLIFSVAWELKSIMNQFLSKSKIGKKE